MTSMFHFSNSRMRLEGRSFSLYLCFLETRVQIQEVIPGSFSDLQLLIHADWWNKQTHSLIYGSAVPCLCHSSFASRLSLFLFSLSFSLSRHHWFPLFFSLLLLITSLHDRFLVRIWTQGQLKDVRASLKPQEFKSYYNHTPQKPHFTIATINKWRYLLFCQWSYWLFPPVKFRMKVGSQCHEFLTLLYTILAIPTQPQQLCS